MNLNKVQLAGRLTADPEIKRLSSGTAVAELRMAVNKTWKDKNGDKKEDVLYVDVTVWEKLAELCAQYLKKGSGAYIEGSLKMDQWQDKNTGEKRTKLKVNGDSVQFLDSKPRDGGGNQNNSGGRYEEPRGRTSAPDASRGEPASRGGYQGQGRPAMTQQEVDRDDDDIPF